MLNLDDGDSEINPDDIAACRQLRRVSAVRASGTGRAEARQPPAGCRGATGSGLEEGWAEGGQSMPARRGAAVTRNGQVSMRAPATSTATVITSQSVNHTIRGMWVISRSLAASTALLPSVRTWPTPDKSNSQLRT